MTGKSPQESTLRRRMIEDIPARNYGEYILNPFFISCLSLAPRESVLFASPTNQSLQPANRSFRPASTAHRRHLQ